MSPHKWADLGMYYTYFPLSFLPINVYTQGVHRLSHHNTYFSENLLILNIVFFTTFESKTVYSGLNCSFLLVLFKSWRATFKMNISNQEFIRNPEFSFRSNEKNKSVFLMTYYFQENQEVKLKVCLFSHKL